MSATNKQVTAVEWFAKQLGIIGTDTLAKAKAMEKNQIINAVSVGYDYCEDGKVRWMGEKYYNETYEKK